jgi:hypothetical protein
VMKKLKKAKAKKKAAARANTQSAPSIGPPSSPLTGGNSTKNKLLGETGPPSRVADYPDISAGRRQAQTLGSSMSQDHSSHLRDHHSSAPKRARSPSSGDGRSGPKRPKSKGVAPAFPSSSSASNRTTSSARASQSKKIKFNPNPIGWGTSGFVSTHTGLLASNFVSNLSQLAFVPHNLLQDSRFEVSECSLRAVFAVCEGMGLTTSVAPARGLNEDEVLEFVWDEFHHFKPKDPGGKEGAIRSLPIR